MAPEMEIILDYLGADVITLVLTRRGQEESEEEMWWKKQRWEPCALKMGEGPQAKECRRPLDAEKGKDLILPSEPP